MQRQTDLHKEVNDCSQESGNLHADGLLGDRIDHIPIVLYGHNIEPVRDTDYVCQPQATAILYCQADISI